MLVTLVHRLCTMPRLLQATMLLELVLTVVFLLQALLLLVEAASARTRTIGMV